MLLRRELTSFLVAGVLTLSCDRAWDAANRRAARADVKALLAAHGAPDLAPDCTMVGVSRDVECEFSATAEDLTHLVSGLSLRPVDSGSSLQDDIANLNRRLPGPSRCVEHFRHWPNVRLYSATGRPPQLRLDGGSAFEFLLLYHDVSTSRACAWLSYSYG